MNVGPVTNKSTQVYRVRNKTSQPMDTYGLF